MALSFDLVICVYKLLEINFVEFSSGENTHVQEQLFFLFVQTKMVK